MSINGQAAAPITAAFCYPSTHLPVRASAVFSFFTLALSLKRFQYLCLIIRTESSLRQHIRTGASSVCLCVAVIML